MKKIFAIILALALITVLFCACGNNNNSATGNKVTTTVEAKYDDGYATKYASSSSTNNEGNKVYEFTEEQYKSYQENHKNSVASDIQNVYVSKHDKNYGEYVYINEEKKAVLVGIHEGEYDEATAKEEAKAAADYGFKYFQSLQNPISTIKVIYCNAGDQSKEYGSFEFTAE